MTGRIEMRWRRLTTAIALTLAVFVASPEAGAADDVIRSIFAFIGAAAREAPYAAAPDQDARFAYAAASPPVPADIMPPLSITPRLPGHTRFCVRLCDGRYFPLSAPAASSGATAARMCMALCPAATTAVFRGDTIDDATADNGERYANLKNAFVYRQKIVPGCTCDGKNGYGLAQIDVRKDPTLRAGDIVAGSDGLKVFKDSRRADRRTADFTPLAHASRLSIEFRRKLANVRVSSGTR